MQDLRNTGVWDRLPNLEHVMIAVDMRRSVFTYLDTTLNFAAGEETIITFLQTQVVKPGVEMSIVVC